MEGRREKRELQSKGIWRARGHGDLVKKEREKKAEGTNAYANKKICQK